jgi:hypothetical protein
VTNNAKLTRLEEERLHLELVELRARTVTALLALPLISNGDMPIALQVSPASWQKHKAQGKAPPCVRLAGRVFYRRDDVNKLIDGLQPGEARADAEHDDEDRNESASTPDCRFLQAAPR